MGSAESTPEHEHYKDVTQVPTFSDVLRNEAERVKLARINRVQWYFSDKRLFPNMEQSIKLFREQTLARAKCGLTHFVCSFAFMSDTASVEPVKSMLECSDWQKILQDAISGRIDGRISSEKASQEASFNLIDSHYQKWLQSECIHFGKLVKERTGMKLQMAKDAESIKIIARW